MRHRQQCRAGAQRRQGPQHRRRQRGTFRETASHPRPMARASYRRAAWRRGRADTCRPTPRPGSQGPAVPWRRSRAPAAARARAARPAAAGRRRASPGPGGGKCRHGLRRRRIGRAADRLDQRRQGGRRDRRAGEDREPLRPERRGVRQDVRRLRSAGFARGAGDGSRLGEAGDAGTVAVGRQQRAAARAARADRDSTGPRPSRSRLPAARAGHPAGPRAAGAAAAPSAVDQRRHAGQPRRAAAAQRAHRTVSAWSAAWWPSSRCSAPAAAQAATSAA